MKHLLVGVALAALLSGTAVAADKKKGAAADDKASASDQANVGRGGLSEWPVSKEEANWKDLAPASSGASSGTSGSDASQPKQGDRD